jgi:hypothetical protein
MTHGQSDSMPNVSTPIVVEGPEQITALDAALTQLLKEDVDSKYLQLSPALRVALRDEWFRMRGKINRLNRNLTAICTELDYLLATIQDDSPAIVEEPDDEVYTPRIDKLWVDAFYQELPIALYSEEAGQ